MEIEDEYDEDIFGKCLTLREYKKICESHKKYIDKDVILVYQMRLPTRQNDRFVVVATSCNINELLDFYKSNLLDTPGCVYTPSLIERVINFISRKDMPSDTGPFYFKKGPLRDYAIMDKYVHKWLMENEIGKVIDYTHLMFSETGIRLVILKKERYEKIKLRLED